ncbi:hypothetical protein [Agromyces badenianii]|uniref:hypothetical protein n=1 Tax=Agromyces badenianii TaxID=2080742 RepID=UPI0011B28A87|nr:hypothetical protein [Agromyces badenianii]
MGRVKRASPSELVSDWPDGQSDDPIARVAQQFVLNLVDAIGEQSVRAVSREAGIDHATLLAVLAGRSWPDMATIGKLERALSRNLWPTGVSYR